MIHVSLFPLAAALAASLTAASADSAAPTDSAERVPVSAIGTCGSGKRINCVVDGDTLWLGGVKIRIADINTPETTRPQCEAERTLGRQATARLITLINAGRFDLVPIARDEDRYGRKLRILMRGGVSLGEQLVAEGLAERWTGKRRNWC